jgi:hypothetical protein
VPSASLATPSDKDEACAIAGIEAAGLKADPGQD